MQKKLITDELLKLLKSTRSKTELHTYTQQLASSSPVQSFQDYLISEMNRQNISSAELIRRAEIQRNYGYQILNGQKHPSRDKVISLCLALSLSVTDTQRVLTLANTSILYPKKQRDSILIFCINNRLTVADTNKVLFDMGEDILS